MIPEQVTLRGIWAALCVAAFALVIALLALQTARIEGFKVWPISVEGWKPKAERLAATIDQMESASIAARDAQQAINTAEETRTRQLAERIDNEQARNQAIARDAVDNYIAANRVRSPDRGIACATPAPASDTDTGILEGVPADTLVYVSDSDVRACSAAVIYAVGAHDWVAGLER